MKNIISFLFILLFLVLSTTISRAAETDPYEWKQSSDTLLISAEKDTVNSQIVVVTIKNISKNDVSIPWIHVNSGWEYLFYTDPQKCHYWAEDKTGWNVKYTDKPNIIKPGQNFVKKVNFDEEYWYFAYTDKMNNQPDTRGILPSGTYKLFIRPSEGPKSFGTKAIEIKFNK